METTSVRHNWLSFAALLLVLPAAWFFCINILNEMGLSGPYHASEPFFERWGSKEPLGWNINLLILLGPVFAFLLTVFQVLNIEWNFSKEQFRFYITVQKRWFPILIALFSLGMLALLFFYLLGENSR